MPCLAPRNLSSRRHGEIFFFNFSVSPPLPSIFFSFFLSFLPLFFPSFHSTCSPDPSDKSAHAVAVSRQAEMYSDIFFFLRRTCRSRACEDSQSLARSFGRVEEWAIAILMLRRSPGSLYKGERLRAYRESM